MNIMKTRRKKQKMSDQKYNIGESVVYTKTLKVGNVVEVRESEDKILLMVEFADGHSALIHQDDLSKFLIEVPPPSGSLDFLGEG